MNSPKSLLSAQYELGREQKKGESFALTWNQALIKYKPQEVSSKLRPEMSGSETGEEEGTSLPGRRHRRCEAPVGRSLTRLWGLEGCQGDWSMVSGGEWPFLGLVSQRERPDKLSLARLRLPASIFLFLPFPFPVFCHLAFVFFSKCCLRGTVEALWLWRTKEFKGCSDKCIKERYFKMH